MAKKTLLAILCCSFGLSGCDRLSEKEKMDMIAKCDTEARTKFEETFVADASGYVSVEIETHYSFEDKQCYAVVETATSLRVGGMDTLSYDYKLYDGLTKKQLLYASCRVDNVKGINECLRDGGGFAVGPLTSETKGGVSYSEGREFIQDRMNRP